jgi:hypothetical protein
MDSWLLFRLCAARPRPTIPTLRAPSSSTSTPCNGIKAVCALFVIEPALLPMCAIPTSTLATAILKGIFPKPIPVHAALGD